MQTLQGREAQGPAGHPLPWRPPAQHDPRAVVAQLLVQGQRLMGRPEVAPEVEVTQHDSGEKW